MTLITHSTSYAHLMTQAKLMSTNNDMSKSLYNLSSEYYSNQETAGAHSIAVDLDLKSSQNDIAIQKAQEFSAVLEIAEDTHAAVATHIERIQAITDELVETGDPVTAEQTYEVAELFDAITDLYGASMFDGEYAFTTTDNPQSLSLGDYDITTSGNSLKSFVFAGTEWNFDNGNYATVATNLEGIYEDLQTSIAGIGADKATMTSVQSLIGSQSEANSTVVSTLMGVDSTDETTKLTQAQMIQQASASVLVQTSNLNTASLGLILRAGG